ncbi:MAG: hypothetical protein WAU89_13490 [Candidatus Acidiferrales bacterium]
MSKAKKPAAPKCFANVHMTPAEYGVYCVINAVSYESDIFYNNRESLAECFAGRSPSTYKRIVESLVKKGWLVCIQEPARTTTGFWTAAQYRIVESLEWHSLYGIKKCRLSPCQKAEVASLALASTCQELPALAKQPASVVTDEQVGGQNDGVSVVTGETSVVTHETSVVTGDHNLTEEYITKENLSKENQARENLATQKPATLLDSKPNSKAAGKKEIQVQGRCSNCGALGSCASDCPPCAECGEQICAHRFEAVDLTAEEIAYLSREADESAELDLAEQQRDIDAANEAELIAQI